jgi:hypothetical protein
MMFYRFIQRAHEAHQYLDTACPIGNPPNATHNHMIFGMRGLPSTALRDGTK